MTKANPADHATRLARAKERFDNLPLHRYLGIVLECLEDGYARYQLSQNERNRGGVHGSVHGGILAFLADVAALAAVSTVMAPDERASGTAELNISYLRPAMGSVTAEARILRKGRTLVVMDIDLSDGQGTLLAKSRVGYALRPASEAAEQIDAR